MKTEKRLTMALSVLVALMMLAVPLASSSNLFVDGGQTNSNGDAPSLGAAGDTLTINLNIPENSLDTIDYDALNTKLNTDYAKLNSSQTNNMVYSISKTGIISAVCIDSTATIKVSMVQDAVIEALKSGVATSRIAAYGEPTFSGVSNKDVPIKGQTLTANWKLNSDKYVEVNVNSTGLGDDFVKVKAYAYASADEKVDKTKMVVDTLPALADINRFVVNLVGAPKELPVYSAAITDASGNEISAGTTIPVSDINIKYSFNSLQFGTITVVSPVFDEPITYYVAKTTIVELDDGTTVTVNATTMYYQVFNTLFADSKLLSDDYDGVTKLLSPSSTITTPLSVNDGSIELSSWTNGGENYELKSNSAIAMGSEITLNAEFTTFPVKFMVNGQAQIVEVKYGDFSEASCPFDITGIVAWMKYAVADNVPTFSSFSFDRESKDLQDELTSSSNDTPLTLIALFSDPTETVYVTFNAGENAFFDADKKINTIIVPIAKGTTADKIPVPVSPSKDADAKGNYLFAYWKETGKTGEYDFSNKNSVKANTSLTAEYITYDFAITLYVDGKIHAVLYINSSFDVDSFTTNFTNNVAGFTYNGKTYLSTDSALNDELKKEIFQPYLSGYNFTSWNDKDGKEIYVFNSTEKKFTGSSEIKTETSLYAEFNAAEYVIIYSGNTAAATNNMVQTGTVGEPLNFFSDATFSNDGYKLKEWNTRPDGKGTSYALGSSFTLSGEDYDKLSKVSDKNGNIPTVIDHGFTLYAIWEKVGGSVTPGDNNEGNDGNNTDTYLLAGILAVIIILIILIAFLMRRKQ